MSLAPNTTLSQPASTRPMMFLTFFDLMPCFFIPGLICSRMFVFVCCFQARKIRVHLLVQGWVDSGFGSPQMKVVTHRDPTASRSKGVAYNNYPPRIA